MRDGLARVNTHGVVDGVKLAEVSCMLSHSVSQDYLAKERGSHRFNRSSNATADDKFRTYTQVCIVLLVSKPASLMPCSFSSYRSVPLRYCERRRGARPLRENIETRGVCVNFTLVPLALFVLTRGPSTGCLRKLGERNGYEAYRHARVSSLFAIVISAAPAAELHLHKLRQQVTVTKLLSEPLKVTRASTVKSECAGADGR